MRRWLILLLPAAAVVALLWRLDLLPWFLPSSHELRLASWNVRIFSTGSRDDAELALIADRAVEKRLQEREKDGTCYAGWIPAASEFLQECRALLVHADEDPEVRIHAAHYLQMAGRLFGDSALHPPLIELAACPTLVDDALAVCTGLLTRFDLPWFAPVCARAAGEGAATHRARLTAFACVSHTGEQLRSAVGELDLDPAAFLIVQVLPPLLTEPGEIQATAHRLIEGGEAVVASLVALLLGRRLPNPVASRLIEVLGSMPSSIAVPALIALLRRRRDVGSKARGTIDRMLQTHFAYARPLLEELAQKGHYHAQLHARRILECARIGGVKSESGKVVRSYI